ncbi:MAG: AAA family ATPase [Deltaproteobacteria bacterium]|nr:AAA family ATPase [Deltaproteobacteria bacterium]
MSETKNVDICFNPSPDKAIRLEPMDEWMASWHQFDEPSIWAVRAALATGRPLLVRGEPGTGKSQLARAVAAVLKRPLLYEVVNSRTEVTDLLFQFDAVARLAEAQIQGASKVHNPDEVRKMLAPERFVRPGRMWWAMNWEEAEAQAVLSGTAVPSGRESALTNGCVLLVDEIDKADSELPNALLECFANQSFQVPYLTKAIRPHQTQPRPLVVVTTNEERELPAPFLRRCLVLQLLLETNDAKLKAFLVRRGDVHFQEEFKNIDGYQTVLETAADLLILDRNKLGSNVVHRPGQAEYLDLCHAVFEIARQKTCGSAEQVLEDVAEFALRKNVE